MPPLQYGTVESAGPCIRGRAGPATDVNVNKLRASLRLRPKLRVPRLRRPQDSDRLIAMAKEYQEQEMLRLVSRLQ